MQNRPEQQLQQALDYQQSGEVEAAVKIYQSLINEYPENASIQNYCGVALFQSGKNELAIHHIKKAITIAPNYSEAHFNLAVALESVDQVQSAILSYLTALKLNPKLVQAYNNLGIIHYQQGEFNKSIEIYRQATKVAPDYAFTYNNFGNLMRVLGNFDMAIDLYQKAINIQPDYADCHYSLGTIHLLLGDLRQGWIGHEWRNHHRGFRQPLWKGENIGDKRLLVYSEQGLGDTIHFFRFIPILLKKGFRLIFECQHQLFSLLEPLCRELKILHIIQRGEPIPEFDFCIPLMSLPYYMGVYNLDLIPSKVPYIFPNQLSTEVILDSNLYKVGLVWAGNPRHENNQHRSLAFEQLAPLLSIKAVELYSLQVGNKTENGIPQPYRKKITDLGSNLRDFRDTALAISQLDLVISVDTSVAHLAGAMGKKVWTLLPANPDFRWLLCRNDSPWYPTMRLFRQSKLGEWSKVVSDVALELRKTTKISI